MPDLPLRSFSPPTDASTSWMHARRASSGAASGGTMPSPFISDCSKAFAAFVASSTVRAVASDLPRLCSTVRAASSSALPSGTSSRMPASGSSERPSSRSSGFFSRPTVQLPAEMMSGARMRPSLSPSTSSSVRASNSSPVVGHASASQSFWSSSANAPRSAPESRRGWSKPPARKKVHLCSPAIGERTYHDPFREAPPGRSAFLRAFSASMSLAALRSSRAPCCVRARGRRRAEPGRHQGRAPSPTP